MIGSSNKGCKNVTLIVWCLAGLFVFASSISSCEYNHAKIKTGTTTFGNYNCERCIECNDSCKGRNLACNNRIPHPIGSHQSCVVPSDGYFVKGGDIYPCRPKCNEESELEVQKCYCKQNRECNCKPGYSKDYNNECKQDEINSNGYVGKKSQRELSTTTEQPSRKNPKSNGISHKDGVIVSAVLATILIVLFLLFTIWYICKRASRRRDNKRENSEVSSEGTDITNLDIVTNECVSYHVEEEKKPLTASPDHHFDDGVISDCLNMSDKASARKALNELIPEKVLHCQCKDWCPTFLKNVGDLLDPKCDDRIREIFFHEGFDDAYAKEKFMFVKSFSDILQHLVSYLPEKFTTKDLIITLQGIPGCEDIVEVLIKYVANHSKKLIHQDLSC